jgi:hypothetical protein
MLLHKWARSHAALTRPRRLPAAAADADPLGRPLSTRDRLEAARLIADRGWGKPVVSVDLDVTQQPMIDFDRYSAEDLDALIAIFERYEDLPPR